jgi:hypothetical protein
MPDFPALINVLISHISSIGFCKVTGNADRICENFENNGQALFIPANKLFLVVLTDIVLLKDLLLVILADIVLLKNLFLVILADIVLLKDLLLVILADIVLLKDLLLVVLADIM